MSTFAPSPARSRWFRALHVLGVCSLAALPFQQAAAQGCVPVKQMGDVSCSFAGFDGMEMHEMSPWSVNFNYQGFRSHRHFRGHHEEKHRAEERTEVVNVVNQLTTTINYQKDNRTSFAVNIPYFHAVRSSLYEHDRVNRYKTGAQGLGDISISGQRWLRSPLSESRTNIALGLAVQLPTGETNVKDTFHRPSGPQVRNVDQSIQPGTGGWGIAPTLQIYHRLAENTTLYGSAYYMITPQETNDTYRSDNEITGRDSIYDSYLYRAGVTQMFIRRLGFAGSLGLRMDGVPALDLVGGSKGFRRPGYTVSVEPGISYMAGKDSFSLTVPVAVSRSRSKSYSDMLTGRHGDAAFADFFINLNYSRHW